LIDRWVLDGGVGKNERGGIPQLLRIGRHIGDEIAVLVAIEGVKLAAVLAFLRGRGCAAGDDPRNHRAYACPRKAAPQVIHFVLPRAKSHRALSAALDDTRGEVAGQGVELFDRFKILRMEPNGGPAIVGTRIAGDMAGSLPIYCRIRNGKRRPLKAAEKTTSRRNERRQW
jgi:hypothetical protein